MTSLSVLITRAVLLLSCTPALAVIPIVAVSADLDPAFDFSKYPECNTTSNATSIPVPKLAPQFSIKVEGKQNSADGFKLFDSEGYYEKDGQRGATVMYANGVRSTYLYDFISGKAYDIEGRNCVSGDLYASGCSPYAVFIAEVAGHSNVSANCQFIPGNVTYLGDQGNETVRAIPVRKWRQCVYDNKTQTLFVSNYYYNKEGIVTPSGSKEVPLRFESKELTGNNTNRTNIFDFTYYAPSITDASVFLPESGSFCPNWTRDSRTMPKLSNQFSLNMMTVSRHAGEVHNIRLSFDYKRQLVSFIADSLNGTHFPPVISRNKTLYRTVHDYDSGLAFVQPIDAWLSGSKKCIVSVIDNSTMDSQTQTNTSTAHLRQAFEMFGMGRNGSNGWVYIGLRNFSSMPCDVWSSQRNSSNQIVLSEVYWLHRNWTTSNTSVFVGMMLYRKHMNGTAIETYQTIVSDYNTYPFQWRTFDVDACLRTSHPLLITFTAKVQNYSEVTARVSTFETGIRDALSTLLNTSPLRFTDIQIMKGADTNQPQIWLTVLEWVNVTGSPNATVQKPSVDVVTDLKNKMANNVDVQITFGGKNQTVTFLKDSLQSGADLVKPSTPSSVSTTPSPPAPPAQIVQDGYTGGSMAGLAIAMIIIGGVAGLVAGFLMWKRNTGIAYQVYD